jgi:phosphate transport system permease protein
MSEATVNPDSMPQAATRPPTLFEIMSDRGFRGLTWGLAWLSVIALGMVVLEIGGQAMPAIKQHGTTLVTQTQWHASDQEFGILPHIFGTIYTSVLALIIGTILGVAVAIFITEDFLAPTWRTLLKNIVELLAAIPSVIYGLWGIYVVIPALRKVFSFSPALSNAFNGPSILPAALVLAIMVLPTITALARDAISNVPPKLKEGAIGLGATRWETIFKITLPTSMSGIMGAVMLGFGRALGETMALAMLVGNTSTLTWDVLSPGNTLAALLANSFSEAVTDPPQIAALMYAALVLMVITLVVNILGGLVIWRASSKLKGLR